MRREGGRGWVAPPPLPLIFCHLCPRDLTRLPLARKEKEKTATQATPNTCTFGNLTLSAFVIYVMIEAGVYMNLSEVLGS